MSLLDDAMTTFILMELTDEPDGYGSGDCSWKEGQEFLGALKFNNSIEAKKAMLDGVTSVYTLITKRDICLNYHDVVKRKSDEKVFRITSDGEDLATPRSAGLDMRNVTCEEWKI